jgi:hypothetical protein
VLAHLDDLQSDFSAIHRIDDMYALDGPTFMRLAFRLPVYQGVMRQRLLLQEHDTTTPRHQSATTPHQATGGEMTAEQVEAMRNQSRAHRNAKALQPGEQPQYVPLEQLA